MINFIVNSNSLEKIYFVSKLDNIGPTYCAEIESINVAIQAMKVVR